MDMQVTLSLLALFVPASLQNVTDWLRPLMFNLFVSHNLKQSTLPVEVRTLEEDAVGLSVISINLLLFATAYGFNGAIDSYTPIAFGAGNRQELFAILWRQAILLCVISGLAIILLVVAEPIFLLIGLEPALAHRAGTLMKMMGFAVPGDFAYDALGRWMRGQQLHRFVAACAMTALACNLSTNILFANSSYASDYPTLGPVLGLIAQNTALPFFLAATYCWIQRRQKSTDITRMMDAAGSADGVGRILGPSLWKQAYIAIAAMLWTCAELWAWEVQVFESAYLGQGMPAAYTLLSSTYSLLICTFPVSVANAAGVLMGEALGQKDVSKAIKILETGSVLTLIIVVCYASPLVICRNSLAELLGGGVPQVEGAYMGALPLVLSMHMLDGLFNVFKFWLTLRQQQAFGAIMSLVIYYGVGVPLGFWLGFSQNWSLNGLWTGLGVAVLLGCVTAAIQLARDIKWLRHDLQGVDEVEAEAANGAYVMLSPNGQQSRDKSAADDAKRRGMWLLSLLLPGMLVFSMSAAWAAPRHD